MDLTKQHHRSEPTLSDTAARVQSLGCISNLIPAHNASGGRAGGSSALESLVEYNRYSQTGFEIDNKYFSHYYERFSSDWSICPDPPPLQVGPESLSFGFNDFMPFPVPGSPPVPYYPSPRPGGAGPTLLVAALDPSQAPVISNSSACHFSNPPTGRLDHNISGQGFGSDSIQNPTGIGAASTTSESKYCGFASSEIGPNQWNLSVNDSDIQHHYHTCLWRMADQGACNAKVLDSKISAHLHACHVPAAPRHVELMCCWVGCSIKLKKKSLLRHIQERHLGRESPFPCPKCSQRFTRRHTRRIHLLKKHGPGGDSETPFETPPSI